MSADNWAICPKCDEAHQAMLAKERADLEKQYGKIPIDDFIKRKARVDALPPQPQNTLRENWELGITGGSFEVNYHASCRNCLFKYDYKHEEKALKQPGGPR